MGVVTVARVWWHQSTHTALPPPASATELGWIHFQKTRQTWQQTPHLGLAIPNNSRAGNWLRHSCVFHETIPHRGTSQGFVSSWSKLFQFPQHVWMVNHACCYQYISVIKNFNQRYKNFIYCESLGARNAQQKLEVKIHTWLQNLGF